MASITIRHTWGDGGVTEIRVQVNESYPDAVAEARANARTLLRDVVADLGEDGE